MNAPRRALVRGGPIPLTIPLLLVAATSTTILSTDLYTPSLPHLAAYFRTDAPTVQLTLSLNLFAYAIGQLILGPVSDRFGRRPVLIIALIVFTAVSAACAAATTIEALLLARVLQGFAAAAEGVLGYAIINDLYDEKGSAKIFAAFGMAVALTPAVAPLLGGWIYVWLGWQAIFLVLAAVSVIVTILIVRKLPETLPAVIPDALDPARIVAGYAAVFANRVFRNYVLVAALPLGALFAFVTEAPFLMIDRMGVATQDYGLYYGAIIVVYFLASLAANRLVDRVGLGAMIAFGLSVPLFAAALLVALVAYDALTPVSLSAAMSVWVFGAAFAFSAAPARAFAAVTGSTGTASAMLGGMQMGCAALGAQAIERLHDGTSWPLAIVIAGSAVLSALAYAFAVRDDGRAT